MNYTYEAERFIPVFEQSFTWISGFMRNVRRFGQHVAMIDPMAEKVWTYAQLNADVNRLANALRARGMRDGDVLLYQLYNSPQFALCYIAPQKLGAVNSPANFNLAPGETARLIDLHRPHTYVYDGDVYEMAVKALELCEYKPEVILCADYRGKHPDLPEGHMHFDAFLAQSGAEEPEADYEPNMYREVTRLFTSGTTGTPKGVPLNNVNEVLSAHDVIMHYPLTPTDVTMNMTPWFHRGGLHSGGITPTFYAGAALVVMRMFSAALCLEYVGRYGVTYLTGVPSALSKLAQRQEKHPLDISGLRGIVTMGSPLEKEECLRYQQVLTKNIFNGYGTTETFWNSFLRPYQLPDMAGSAGGSCTDDEVRVIRLDSDKRIEPEDTVPMDSTTEGEIIIRSWAKSSQSYYKNPQQTQDRFYKGWYYTRDIGVWNEESIITVRGRKDDMIICMGENIYPAQLEEVINAHPGVRDCMVTGVPDPSRGEAVAAYVISEDENLTVRELNRYCTGHDDVSTYKCPRYYRFVTELPYNSTGKKLHNELKKIAAEDLEKGLLLRP